jgi:hypothetical protein
VSKRFGPFDVWKVLESQKYEKNMITCPIELKPKERGLFRKSPDSTENMSSS